MLWPIIRIFVSAIVIFETAFAGLFNGILMRPVEMPEPVTGEYSQYVDPFIGTGGTPWTCGMLSPAATVPFGAVRLGPDTSFMGGLYITKMNTSGYYYENRHITGFSHSRLSGTGAEDYGIFRVTPVTGKKKPGVIPYSHRNEIATAGYYALYLESMNCLVELTADTHTGVHRYTFNNSKDARLYLDVTSVAAGRSADSGFADYDEETGMLTGGAVIHGAFSDRYDGLPVYFAATADKEIKSCEIKGDSGDLGIDINFGEMKNESIELKLAVSFVSVENAKLNLAAETDGLTFDDVRNNAVADWEDRLSSIKISSSDDEIKTIFYTALYHSMIMPTDFTDVNGEYLGFDKQVHTADGYTYRSDMSLWDTCRDTHSLYTLIEPEIQSDCLKSLVEMTKIGGNIPRWPQGAGYASSMHGDPTNIMITESYLKGYRDFDVETLYEAMKKTSEAPVRKSGRNFVEEYNKYGYIPDDLANGEESVSFTLEYAWEDNAIAVLAAELGYNEDAERYSEKAMYYKNLFNPETKYFQPRNSDGTFVKRFNPNITAFHDMFLIKKYATAYSEGGARHWRWSATHDIDGMIELFGSKEYFVSELDKFMKDASLNRAAIDPGSGFWIGNQHDIHTPYLFANAGRADLTQKWVRWTLDNRFSTDVNGLDGNDDGGTLSSWYVFSAMGFYPLAGTDKYWLGSPNLDSAEITLANGKLLKITAENQGKNNVYASKITLNGNELDGCYVTHDELMNGGELVFTMTK